MGLLKNWLKMFKGVAEEESNQTFRLWMYSVFSNQTYTMDVCDINPSKLQEIEGRMEKGWKCNLFRLNGSYKQAMFRYDRGQQQLIAYKHPGGDRKTKYCLPLRSILFIYRYQSQDDYLLLESRFTRTLNPFQHDVNFKHCLTIFSLIEEKFEVREISLEMATPQDMEEVYLDLRIVLNKMAEKQKEEEVKYWIAKSSRDIPLSTYQA
jgi:hypothetical protein